MGIPTCCCRVTHPSSLFIQHALSSFDSLFAATLHFVGENTYTKPNKSIRTYIITNMRVFQQMLKILRVQNPKRQKDRQLYWNLIDLYRTLFLYSVNDGESLK